MKPLSIILAFLLLLSEISLGKFSLQIGPAARGLGGTNPISIPPTNISQYEASFVTKGKTEFTFGFSPGIFYGQRLELSDDFYFSVGGGIVISTVVGLGAYTSVGYDFWCPFVCFHLEYKQAIGFNKRIISPYALRIGFNFES